MSRITKAKAVVLAGTVAATALVAGQASAANSTTHALTGASPAVVATTGGSNITLTGRGFTANSTVAFSGGTCTGGGTVVPFGSSSTQLVVTPPTSCTNGDKPSITVTFVDNSNQLSTPLTNKVTFVTPVAGTASFGSTTTGPAGTAFTVTGLTSVPLTGASATLGGVPVANFKALSTSSISGKVPAGLAPGAHDLVITSNRVPSAGFSGFTVLSSIRVSPSVWVKGTTAPQVRIEGNGFKPLASGNATPTVKFCGVPAATVETTGTKAYTDKVIYATPPTFSSAAAGTPSALGGVHATDGGVCAVTVEIDSNGTTADGGGQVNHVNVLTSTSTFTYAAY